MTAFSKISRNQTRTAGNIKDQPKRRAGGDYTRANTWVQQWGEGLPRFEISPEVRRTDKGLQNLMVARCTMAGVEKTWSAHTDYGIIRNEVNDLILEIMRHDAKLADGPLWDIDIDEFMEVNTNA